MEFRRNFAQARCVSMLWVMMLAWALSTYIDSIRTQACELYTYFSKESVKRWNFLGVLYISQQIKEVGGVLSVLY